MATVRSCPNGHPVLESDSICPQCLTDVPRAPVKRDPISPIDSEPRASYHVVCSRCGAERSSSVVICPYCPHEPPSLVFDFIECALPTNEAVIIGRGSGILAADLQHRGHVSRTHARVEYDGTVARLMDLGSANGTFVNGDRTPVGVAVELHDGDLVRFGDEDAVVARFRDPTATGTPRT